MTEPNSTRRGFLLPCPNPECPSHDDTENGSMTVELDGLDRFHCYGCDEDFTAADVRGLLPGWEDGETWLAVLAWLATAPEI